MSKRLMVLLWICCLSATNLAFAVSGGGGADADAITVQQEYENKITAAKNISRLGDNMFGESVNAYTGAVEFSVTDVDLPGNNGLRVSVTRRLAVDYLLAKRPHPRGTSGAFRDWEFDLPYLYGVYSGDWTSADGVNARCTEPSLANAAPPTIGVFDSNDYWHGNFLHVPEQSDEEILHVDSASQDKPTDGLAYYWTTKSRWYFSCLPTTANGEPGEAFLARAPDGTKYWFDIYGAMGARSVKKGNSTLYRSEKRFFPSRIEDRFGNWVAYTYDSVNENHLLSISASDGRHIDVTYAGSNSVHVQSVTDGTRTWTYQYLDVSLGGTLTGVTLPDGSKWIYDFSDFQLDGFGPSSNECGDTASYINAGDLVVHITHPSGALGNFTFNYRTNGRTFVPKNCWQADGTSGDRIPKSFVTVSLSKKEINGPGLTVPAVWTWTYPAPVLGYDTQCATSGCATTKVISEQQPGGLIVRRTFGIRYGVNEGMLLQTDNVATDGVTVLNSATSTTLIDPSGQNYPFRAGDPFKLFNEPLAGMLTPVSQRTITQQGVTFNWAVNQTNGVYAFDRFANPTSITRSSSGGAGGDFSRAEVMAYYNDVSQWVVGQVATVTDSATGKVIKQNDYDLTSDLPIRTYSFGILRQTLSYNADGTVATVKDGLNHTIALSSWFRGVPRLITYPTFKSDNVTPVSESAVMNTIGTLASTTDELGYATAYSYDGLGRLAGITYPTGDSTAWNGTNRSFVPVTVDEYGVAAGHWKQTIQTGTGVASTIFDAQWRPVVVITEDTANGASKSFVVKRYDAAGQEVFSSYPVGSLSTVNDALMGVYTEYDALGRVTRVKQDSELGVLTTTTDYLSAFVTRVTNPRGGISEMSYQVFDLPRTDFPVNIVMAKGLPEQQTTVIVRDGFGKPLSVTRSGAQN